jgi:hypothetical protein
MGSWYKISLKPTLCGYMEEETIPVAPFQLCRSTSQATQAPGVVEQREPVTYQSRKEAKKPGLTHTVLPMRH